MRTGKYLSYFKHYVDSARMVVDVGCGAGTFSRALACRQRLVIALDVGGRLLEGIKNPYVERICADAHSLSLREGSMNCVKELYRLLKHDGTAIIQIPNLRYPFKLHTKWSLQYLLPKKLQLRS